MLTFDGFEFDLKSGVLKSLKTETEVHLRQKLVALLDYLHRHQDRVVSKQELLDNLWEHGQYREKSLAQSILELRKALGDSVREPKYIRTLPNQGYQWIAADTMPASPIPCGDQVLALTPSKEKRKILIWVTLSIVMISLVVFAFKMGGNQKTAADKPLLRVLVLPFKNNTGTQVMNWVEYGLSEMLAYDLSLIESVEVIAPTELKNPIIPEPMTAEWQQGLIGLY